MKLCGASLLFGAVYEYCYGALLGLKRVRWNTCETAWISFRCIRLSLLRCGGTFARGFQTRRGRRRN